MPHTLSSYGTRSPEHTGSVVVVRSMEDLSFLTRVQTQVPCIARQFLTTGASGKSLGYLFLEINQAYIPSMFIAALLATAKKVKATQGSIHR